MEASTCISIATSLVCILLATISWKVLNWAWLKPKRLEKILRNQGFKGNPYRFLHGDSKDSSRMVMEARSKPMQGFSNDYLSRIYPFFVHTVNKHGERCFMWNGPELVVNILDPKLIKEVLTNMRQFQKLKTNPIISVIGTGLVGLEGHEWDKHRKILNPAFHMEKLKFMVPAFSESCSEIINKWEEMVKDKGFCEIDVWPYFHKFSADVISRAAFGSNYEEGKRIFELITEQLLTAVPILNSYYIPGWRFVPTKANTRIMEIQKEIISLLTNIINKRQKAIKAGEEPKDDLLGTLLHESSLLENSSVVKAEKKQSHKGGLSLEEVIGECKIFYLTGHTATNILLAWTLIMLSMHQDWQTRARDEVLGTFGKNTPHSNGLSQLKIVNMILQEVLRLYPPATEIRRSVCEDIKVGDIVLPAGVQVNLPILHIQHEEKYWGDDAKEFKPERFSEGISNATRGNNTFLAFGWGPRTCIGSNFAMIEARVALAMILQRFSLEISPTYVHAPTSILQLLKPQFGAQIIFSRLEDN